MYNDAWDDYYDEREDAREDWQDHREDLADERGDRARERAGTAHGTAGERPATAHRARSRRGRRTVRSRRLSASSSAPQRRRRHRAGPPARARKPAATAAARIRPPVSGAARNRTRSRAIRAENRNAPPASADSAAGAARAEDAGDRQTLDDDRGSDGAHLRDADDARLVHGARLRRLEPSRRPRTPCGRSSAPPKRERWTRSSRSSDPTDRSSWTPPIPRPPAGIARCSRLRPPRSGSWSIRAADARCSSSATRDGRFRFLWSRVDSGWRFDTAAGKEEVLARRIGRNELAVITICRTYVAAQQLYAEKGHDGQPAGLYARTFRSDAGRENGLFWPAGRGQKRSPLGDLVAHGRGGRPADWEGWPAAVTVSRLLLQDPDRAGPRGGWRGEGLRGRMAGCRAASRSWRGPRSTTRPAS